MSPKALTPAWTTPEDVAAVLRRRWSDGSLLRAQAGSEPFPEVSVPLRGPTPTQIGDDLQAVRAWVARLDAGRRGDARYRLEFASIGGRHIGRNRLPTRAVVSSYAQAWALLGVGEAVSRFDEILKLVASEPTVRAWVVANPLRALELDEDWPPLLSAYQWLEHHRGTGSYLREISAPGVDTKFAERHRATLAGLLGVPSSTGGFLAGLGLRTKPAFVRARIDPWVGRSAGLPSALSELVVRADELRTIDLAPRQALVCENETTYLSVPVPPRGLVVWGKGFDIDRVGRLPWLQRVPVTYWGDLDTHGFAILDRLRAWLPETVSVLMDRETLFTHRDRWVTEPTPTHARLSRLNAAEQDLYEDLVSDRLAERVRLEQERIDWSWALNHLPRAHPA